MTAEGINENPSASTDASSESSIANIGGSTDNCPEISIVRACSCSV